jgi:hypothetical protein
MPLKKSNYDTSKDDFVKTNEDEIIFEFKDSPDNDTLSGSDISSIFIDGRQIDGSNSVIRIIGVDGDTEPFFALDASNVAYKDSSFNLTIIIDNSGTSYNSSKYFLKIFDISGIREDGLNSAKKKQTYPPIGEGKLLNHLSEPIRNTLKPLTLPPQSDTGTIINPYFTPSNINDWNTKKKIIMNLGNSTFGDVSYNYLQFSGNHQYQGFLFDNSTWSIFSSSNDQTLFTNSDLELRKDDSLKFYHYNTSNTHYRTVLHLTPGTLDFYNPIHMYDKSNVCRTIIDNDGNIDISGTLTASNIDISNTITMYQSGNIDASGIITAQGLDISNTITMYQSGNIDASGIITAQGLDISNTITMDESGIDLSGDNTHFSFPIHSSVVTGISNNTVVSIDGSFNETPYKYMSIGSMVFDTSFCYIKLSNNQNDKRDWRRIMFDDNWPETGSGGS